MQRQGIHRQVYLSEEDRPYAPQLLQPPKQRHRLRTTMRPDMSLWRTFLHSNRDTWGIYLICAGPSMTEGPCSDELAGLDFDCLVSGFVYGCLSTQEQHCSCVGC